MCRNPELETTTTELTKRRDAKTAEKIDSDSAYVDQRKTLTRATPVDVFPESSAHSIVIS